MVNGQKMEPLEEVVCEIEDEFSGPIIDALSLRRAEVCHYPSVCSHYASVCSHYMSVCSELSEA